MLDELIARDGTDLHLAAGTAPNIRVHGLLSPLDSAPALCATELDGLVRELVGEEAFAELADAHELDTAISLPSGHRLRINAYFQQDTIAAAIRLLPADFFALDALGLPLDVCERICEMQHGLVLVTGATSSGKSTTLASLLNRINELHPYHIITIEDPIEYKHTSKRSFVTQREVGRDTASFHEALRRAMREDPDVVLVGEMRDRETMAAALTLAETGHLTFATLHTSSAIQTITRVISAFPANEQSQVRIQLASTLRVVFCQQLIPWPNGGGRSLAAEVLVVTPAVRALIRESKTHQIGSAIQTGVNLGMRTMNQSLAALTRSGRIDRATAEAHSPDTEDLQRVIGK
jgi:twitching motility protein PilT